MPTAGSVPGLALVRMVENREQMEPEESSGVGVVDMHWDFPMTRSPWGYQEGCLCSPWGDRIRRG